MIGVPVIINHQDVSKENADEIRRGVVSDVWYNPVINWFECAGVIWDETAQNLITDKGWSVSCSYDVKLADDAGGTENNIPYDIEFLDGVFTHLAIVDNPRYERANIVFNSKTVVKNDANFEAKHPRDEQGKFTDDRGAKSFEEQIKDVRELNKGNLLYKKTGVSNREASIASKVDNLSDNIITDFQEDFNPDMKNNKVVNDKWITIKPHGKDSDDYRRIKLEDGETPKEAIERIYKKEDTTEETQAKGETQDNPLDDRKERINKLVKLADDISMFDSGSIEQREHQRLLDEIKKLGLSKEETEKAVHNLWDYHENILKYKAKAPSAYKVGPAEFNKRVGFEKSNSNYEKALNLEGERRSYIDSLKKQLKQIEKEEESQKLFKAQTEAITKGLLEYKLGDKTYFRPSKRGKTFYLLDQYTQAKYDKMKKANNNKEQDMALLDELKKLITKVENDKGEDMDDKEKVENEKVDKRKLIDEIGGILKGKVDEELWRTIIGKAEKIAYDKSEAGTADNACDDDEEEVKNKKVKNEETEKDKEEYEEFKKDVKEDVQNKCKNSVENSKNGGYFDKMNEIYNSANELKEENLYISREQKLKDAETYFAK